MDNLAWDPSKMLDGSGLIRFAVHDDVISTSRVDEVGLTSQDTPDDTVCQWRRMLRSLQYAE